MPAYSRILLPWDSQPQEAAGVDWGNPLSAGLKGLFLATESGLVQVFGGARFPATETSVSAVGPAGVARDYSSTQKTAFAYNPNHALVSAMTLMVLFDIDTLTSFSALISCEQTDSTSGYELRLGSSSTASDISMERNTATAYKQYIAGGSNFVAGSSRNFLAVTYPDENVDTAPTYYINGVTKSSSSTAGTGTGVQGTPTSAQLTFGARAAGSTRLDGRIYFAALFGRALSSGEIESVRLNPWALFAPRTIWVPVSAGGGSVTGTVAYTNANDTSSASGTTTATGTLAKSNASDTSAASGTTTVLGASNATNTDDTAAASGSVGSSGSTGTVNATNANDTSAAAGTTTVTGTVARSNTSDGASASGWAGLISGTVNESNANDAASASGDAGAVARRHAGGYRLRKGYIIKGRRYWLDEVELAVKVAEMIADIGRADIKEVTAGKPKTISKRTWDAIKPLERIEALADMLKPHDDDEEEALLMLM